VIAKLGSYVYSLIQFIRINQRSRRELARGLEVLPAALPVEGLVEPEDPAAVTGNIQ
jgi:hypothetical protein